MKYILDEEKKKRRKPYTSKTVTTGDPVLNIAFFNKCMGTDLIPDEEDNKEAEKAAENITDALAGGEVVTGGAEVGSDGGALSSGESGSEGMGESLEEAKREVRRYYVRPQNIFCSNKAEVIKALIEVGNNNCSVYTLKNLKDNDDIHKLTTKDIIYYYDDGILYDKNKVRVMDYDLYIKHEEERKHFTGNPNAVSDAEFDKAYSDRITARTDLEESTTLQENSILYEVSHLRRELVEDNQEVLIGTLHNDPEATAEWNKRRDEKQNPSVEPDEEYSYTEVNAFYDAFEEKFIVFCDYIGTKNHKIPSVVTETFDSFDDLLKYTSSLSLDKSEKKEGLNKVNMRTTLTEKLNIDKLKELVEKSDVVEPIYLGYNMEDADRMYVDDEQYSNTDFHVYKDGDKYVVYKTYISHHGGEEDGPETTYDTFEQFADWLSNKEIYDCPLVESVNIDEAFALDFVGVNAFNEAVKPKYTCCICGEEFEGYGNNPAPYKDEGTCCDACNLKFVIPARLAQYQEEYDIDCKKGEGITEAVEEGPKDDSEYDTDFECYDCFDDDAYAGYEDLNDEELLATNNHKNTD